MSVTTSIRQHTELFARGGGLLGVATIGIAHLSWPRVYGRPSQGWPWLILAPWTPGAGVQLLTYRSGALGLAPFFDWGPGPPKWRAGEH